MVGSTLALLLARQRLRIALVGKPAPVGDVRAFALNAHSQTLLTELRCWPDQTQATAVQGMQVWGDAGGNVQFQAPSFNGLTHIVDVPALEHALAEAIHYQKEIHRIDTAPEATLTVICEGRDSPSRQAMGIAYDTLPYAQHALATRVRGELPHRQQAFQWFTQSPAGLEILALLPMGGMSGQEAAVVWSLPTEKALTLSKTSEAALSEALSQASQQVLGPLRVSSPVQCWPLQSALAQTWHGQFEEGQAWVLAGDAAHTIHPLAGLGLNLGLADVDALAQVLKARETHAYWRRLDDTHLLRQYERARKAGIQATWLACDGLQRLFNHPHPAVQQLRNWGLNRFNGLSSLKQWTIQQAMHSPT